MKADKRARAKNVAKAMRLTISSLRSHLRYTHEKPNDGDNKFHQKCVKEYVDLLKHLSELF